jgi:hypothetical protein
LSSEQFARSFPYEPGGRLNKRRLSFALGALAVAAVLSAQLITASAGVAYGEGTCTVLASGAVVCTTGGGGGGGAGTTTTTVPPGSPPSAHLQPYYIVYVPCDECVSGGTDEICTAQGTVGFDPKIPADWVPGDPLPDGDTLLQLEEEVSSTTGKVLGVVPDSAPNVGGPCNGHAPTPAPPPPPSPAEAWAAAVKDLPVPQIRSNPVAAGLVQLETWFWLGNDAAGIPVTVTAAAGGGSVTATVYPASYTWDFGPPGAGAVTSYTAGAPGSASSASAVYTYVDKGTYEVTVAVNWSGSYTFDKGAPIALRAVSEEQSFPYEVREVRSVLGGPS